MEKTDWSKNPKGRSTTRPIVGQNVLGQIQRQKKEHAKG